jgi:hypothetical protein
VHATKDLEASNQQMVWRLLAIGLVVTVGLAAAVLAIDSHAGLAQAGPAGQGYWMVASDGGIFSFGDASFHGSTASLPLKKPIVGMASMPGGQGYWLVASDGGVFSGGDARFHGSTGGMALDRPIVGMAATPDGQGYWLVASDGGVFSFGDAEFHGSAATLALTHPIVGMAATADGQGYWLVASDGGVFSYGDASYHGSAVSLALTHPIVGMAATPDGQGYWLVASDGGVFSYGDASYHGSAGALRLKQPIVGITSTPDGQGYWLGAADGGVFSYGDATFEGSNAGLPLKRPIVGVAAMDNLTTGSPHGSNAYCGFRTGPATTSKLLVIWEENANASSVYGNAAAPNMNAYAKECGHATDYVSLGHPSLPNYLDATSAVGYATTPWTNDCEASASGCQTASDNIFAQVGPAGWKAYAQSMPTPCDTSNSGLYVARHNPAVYYTDLGASCAANDVNIGSPAAGPLYSAIVNGTLPTFATITPDLDHDQHNGTLAQADAYLASWIPEIVAGPDYQSGRLAIVIVYDEGAGSGTNSPSTVAAIVLSPFVAPGTTSAIPFTQYSLLAAAEDVAGVPRLNNAITANSMRAAFGF